MNIAYPVLSSEIAKREIKSVQFRMLLEFPAVLSTTNYRERCRLPGRRFAVSTSSFSRIWTRMICLRLCPRNSPPPQGSTMGIRRRFHMRDVRDVVAFFICDRCFKQTAVAKKTGMTDQQLSDVVNKRRKLDANELFRLCEAINISPNEVYEATMQSQHEGR